MMDSIKSALGSVLNNRLRSFLTVSIIATGIMALVGIETSIEILSERLAGSFNRMGARMYTVCSKDECSPVTYRQASIFTSRCEEPLLSIHSVVLRAAQVRSGESTTDPVVTVVASDGHYLECQSSRIASGRDFSSGDLASASYVALLGDNVRRKLFGDGAPPDEVISISGVHYVAVGYIERQGAVFGTGLDDSVIIPVTNARGVFLPDDARVSITVRPSDDVGFMESVCRSEALMRSARRLRPFDKVDFQIVRSNSVRDNFLAIKKKLSLAALGTGMVTLLGAAVGLMNIMLVSVRERRREIGIRKALGACASAIERQFLMEAVAVGQIGCVAGIVLGLAAGNLVAVVMDGSFTVPWPWLAVAVALAFAVSVFSGFLPARRAAALDPVLTLHD